MIKKILQKDAPVLRGKAMDVPVADMTSSKIKKVISEMRVALESQEDGVAIAGPQIGYPLRIFIVSHRVPAIVKGKDMAKDSTEKTTKPKDTVFINPTILKLSKEKQVLEEGCLSVRYLYGRVSRAKKATVEAYDENGKKFTQGASGLLAQIFQHETDHLNGVLFIDKATDVEEIPPENEKNLKQNDKSNKQ